MEEKNIEHDELIENCKLLITTINNMERINRLEQKLTKHKFRYELLDFFLIYSGIDFIIRSIFGTGIIGIIICIYRYIIGIF